MNGDDEAEYAVGICQRTGFKVPAHQLQREWTGLLVREQSWEPRHPALDVPPPRGERVRENATGPENANDNGDVSGAPTLDELATLVNGGG